MNRNKKLQKIKKGFTPQGEAGHKLSKHIVPCIETISNNILEPYNNEDDEVSLVVMTAAMVGYINGCMDTFRSHNHKDHGYCDRLKELLGPVYQDYKKHFGEVEDSTDNGTANSD